MSRLGRRGSAQIREDLDPAVKFVLHAIRDRETDENTFWRIEAGSGLGMHTVRMWQYQPMTRGPYITSVRAALNALGYDLAVVPLQNGGTS
jgi:hypothetical protein